MCFSSGVSIFTFVIGLVFSVLLITYGNPKYSVENRVTDIFFIFISLIQFMDFLFWMDIQNKYGINRFTTIVGPILNVCQPTILYLIKYFYFRPNLFLLENMTVAILNVLYFIYFITMYVKFLSNEKMITGVKHGHLDWTWLKYSNRYFYVILLGINLFYLFDIVYAAVLFAITYFFLLISATYFQYNVGELWCFLVLLFR